MFWRALDGAEGVQNCMHEVGTYRPTECREKGRASMFLIYLESLDESDKFP